MNAHRIAAHGSAPAWFRRAIGELPEHRSVRVEGGLVHYLSWQGPPRAPGIVLVHGGAAHAHWWSFLAPLLIDRYRVAALDLTGHGDSDRRAEYPRELWAREVVEVIRDCRFDGPPIVVGHSMGGLVSIVAASLHGDALSGAVIVDAPVRRPDPESREGQRGRAFRNPKVYADVDSAVAHFRLVPDQPCANEFIVDWIARHSVRRGNQGWSWKFDPGVFGRFNATPMRDYLASTRCRVALFRGQYSEVVSAQTGDYMHELLHRSAPLIEIPEAHHHLMLDQPLAFVAALRAILADWEHSTPNARARLASYEPGS